MNVAVVDPAGTVSVAGTMSGSVADRVITAPPAGAGAPSVMVPFTWFPPTTVEAASETDTANACPVTVTVGGWRVLPPPHAVIVALPRPLALLANDAVLPPTALVTSVRTL